jgi:hypothetical protein
VAPAAQLAQADAPPKLYLLEGQEEQEGEETLAL